MYTKHLSSIVKRDNKAMKYYDIMEIDHTMDWRPEMDFHHSGSIPFDYVMLGNSNSQSVLIPFL